MMRTDDLAAARQEDDLSSRVECVQDVSGFAALQPCWNELLQASAADNPFLTFEWLYPWWTHLADHARLQLLAVRSGETLIAVAPLMTRRSFGWLPRVEFLGTGHAGSDYLDLIVRRGYEADAVRRIAQFVVGEGWSLRLDHVLERSVTATLSDRLRTDGWTSTMVPNGICPVIDLAGHTWTSYLASRGSAHRANVRRRLKAAEELLRPTFERVTTECQRREALLALFDFHDSRFRERGGSTAFLTGALRAFHDEATQRMLESGGLRMYVLRVDGAVAAAMYGFGHNQQFFFYQHGFDSRYQRRSIGLVLMAYTIRAAFDEGMHTYDMLWGAEPYKWLWATRARTLYRVHLFPAHVGGWLHRSAVEARRRLAPLTRRALMLGASRV
jgi:CelD/BcsL family acetyltransferase involved in cellulose biosynthesis